MEVVKKGLIVVEEKNIPTKEEIQRLMGMELNPYNRKEYYKIIKGEILELITNNQMDNNPILDGIDVILKKFEDRVSLITFETNAFRMSIQGGKIERI